MNLSSEKLVSKFAFKRNLYRYITGHAVVVVLELWAPSAAADCPGEGCTAVEFRV